MIGLCARGFTLSLICIAARSDSPGLMAGDAIILARPGVMVHKAPGAAEETASKQIAQVLHAIAVDGDWIRIPEGWLPRSDVVRMDRAIDHFSQMVAQSPTAFAYVSRATARWFESDVADAREANGECLADAESAIGTDPRSAIAYCLRGAARRRLGDSEAALVDFDEALQLEPRLARAFWERSKVYFSQMDFRLALRDVEQAVRLDPHNPMFLSTRAATLYMVEQYDPAIRDFEEAVRRDPFLSVNDGLARCLRRRALRFESYQDIPAAIADFDRAERLYPEIADVRLVSRRGSYSLMIGDARRALADFQQALLLAPDIPELHRRLADALACSGDGKTALIELDKAIGLGERGATIFHERGRLRASMGDHRGAIVDFDTAIELDPWCPDALADRASERLKMGDPDGAISDCDEALRLGQTSANTTRATILLSRNQFSEAVINAGCAILLCDDAPTAYQLRGLAYAGLGNHDAAVNDLTSAIKLAEQAHLSGVTKRPMCAVPREYVKVFTEGQPAMTVAALAELYAARADSFDALRRPDKAAIDRDRAAELARSGPIK